jgi:GPH family glycoside/pentoside/hexuronide:cation symporter
VYETCSEAVTCQPDPEETIITQRSPSRAILWLFGAGDFGFNLFWQSVSLYLLFFYLDVQAFSPGVAGGLLVIGAVWDGVADLLAGILADRWRVSYRKLVGWGAVPLGLAFVAMFAATPAAVALALAGQLAFRICRPAG